MQVYQKTFALPAMPKGFHLITKIIEKNLTEMPKVTTGIVHIFIHHTSAGLTINENADPTVRHDFEKYFQKAVPENEPYFRHTQEGPDDMPAHIKSSLMGSSISVPLAAGKLLLSAWQGIYLCEHRNDGGPRSITITFMGI